MSEDQDSATRIIDAAPDVVFGVLADPTAHAAIDGTGWVSESVDSEPLTAAGQMFRMAMYHPKHPDGSYEMANRVQLFDRPRTISWEPGHNPGDGSVSFGGWVWRYDLAPADDGGTAVTLTYDWSAVPDSIRAYLHFPPFRPGHLESSLEHLAGLVADR
jgi:hypothetical protein